MRYRYLIQKVTEHKCKKIMEVGTHQAYHAIQMVQYSSKIDGRTDNIDYYGFDLFESYEKDESSGNVKIPFDIEKVRELMHSSGQYLNGPHKVKNGYNNTGLTLDKNNIHLYKGDTRKTIPNFVSSNPDLKMDLIYIDGGHSIENIQTDWDNVQPLIDEHTVIIFDDYNKPQLGWGCNTTVDGLSLEDWNVEVLSNCDSWNDGRTTCFVLVEKKEKLWWEDKK